MFNKIKEKSKKIKENLSLLYIAYKHPRTPWYAKLTTIITISYALSPIDLIPDFIPVLGYLDDIIIVPAGIALSLKLIPSHIIDECKNMRGERENFKNKGIFAAVIIMLLWIWLITFILKVLNITPLYK